MSTYCQVNNHGLQSRSQSHPPPPFRSPDPPQFPLAALNPTAQCKKGDGHDSMHFVSFTQSEGTQMTYDDPVFLPTDQIQVEFVPSGSVSSLSHENTSDKSDSARSEMV